MTSWPASKAIFAGGVTFSLKTTDCRRIKRTPRQSNLPSISVFTQCFYILRRIARFELGLSTI
ncbi:hypothetical protein M404DRAFT_1006889 [Pisolithus tinctorius Marx 270]|uniref:Uncharacterized protein n=1 Tax=Pisolithus tinctorius Marx 270 TaxID=870435 RepID=A0A0C3N5C6_PISTI|nr:hypothetical protein M404DRAFT_1006889 [Pisolithus tinctorius Marx 270]